MKKTCIIAVITTAVVGCKNLPNDPVEYDPSMYVDVPAAFNEFTEQNSASDSIALVSSQVKTNQVDLDLPFEAEVDLDNRAIKPAVSIQRVQEIQPQHEIANNALPRGYDADLDKDTSAMLDPFVLNDEPTFSYYLYAGETYSEGLYRWLSKAGYDQIGSLFENEGLQQALALPVGVNYKSVNTLAGALAELKTQLKLASPQVQTDSLTVDLFQKDHQAIIHDSDLPVRMHVVKAGLLKDAFVDLVQAYGWKATAAHYLANGDYTIDFQYVIVTHRDDIKSALSRLINPYLELSVGLVPSSHEVFLQQEELN